MLISGLCTLAWYTTDEIFLYNISVSIPAVFYTVKFSIFRIPSAATFFQDLKILHSEGHSRLCKPIRSQCTLSLPPENIKKRQGFLMFSEGRERVHWEQMGWTSMIKPFAKLVNIFLAVNYFRKKIHFRYLTVSRMQLWIHLFKCSQENMSS